MDSSNNNEAEFLSLKKEVEEMKALLKATLEGFGKPNEDPRQDHPIDFANQEEPIRIHEEYEADPRVRAEAMVRTYGTKSSSSPTYSPNFPSSPTPSPHREGRSRRPHKRHHARKRSRTPTRYTHDHGRHHSSTYSYSSSKGRSFKRKQRIFKAGDKDIKFETFNGKRNITKALSFIRQFDVAFVQEDFTEKSKLRHVGMYLKGMASDWWLTKILEKEQARTWKDFRKQFFKQFLPPNLCDNNGIGLHNKREKVYLLTWMSFGLPFLR